MVMRLLRTHLLYQLLDMLICLHFEYLGNTGGVVSNLDRLSDFERLSNLEQLSNLDQNPESPQIQESP